MKGDAVVGLCEDYIALARSILRRLSFTIGDSVPDFQVRLGTDDLNCVDVSFHLASAVAAVVFSQVTASSALCGLVRPPLSCVSGHESTM